MESIRTLDKILKIQEDQKSEAQRMYNEKLDAFEQKATALYQALKMKEDAEERYQKNMAQSATISSIQQQSRHLLALDKEIELLEKSYLKARSEMEKEQENLHIAHIEVKKFETLIDHRMSEYEAVIKKDEQLMMDEISIQQYMNSQAR